MDPTTEATAIFTRLFEALARSSGKTLSTRSRQDIARACELLGRAGAELGELLDDLPSSVRTTPGEAANAYAAAAEQDPNFQAWKRRRAAEADSR